MGYTLLMAALPVLLVDREEERDKVLHLKKYMFYVYSQTSPSWNLSLAWNDNSTPNLEPNANPNSEETNIHVLASGGKKVQCGSLLHLSMYIYLSVSFRRLKSASKILA
jgi:hypothetical protein